MSLKQFLGLLFLWLVVALFVAEAFVTGSMPQDLLYPMLGVLIFTLIAIFVFSIKEIFE